MPNYYIQAKRGTFNPFSFDEYVKPLNMYKEYYERNEEAITDMQEQANLWKNIMESEKDSKLADKYNTYVNNLNNATQQLKNGMSYNLRNQIQQLRVQSAMVKQIENAYNLRAKDIDAYNQLMLQDPSRIGADDPTTRSLNDYLNGPVKNNYGVSGDVLYKKGAIAGQAYTLRSKKSFDSTKDGVITTTTTMGLTNEDISRELNNPNSDLHKEADKILQAQGITPDVSYYNAAKNEILKGIIDGISYETQKSYHNVPENSRDNKKTDIIMFATSDNADILKSKDGAIAVQKRIPIKNEETKETELVTTPPIPLSIESNNLSDDVYTFKDDFGSYYITEKEGDFKSIIETNKDGIEQIAEFKNINNGEINRDNIEYLVNGKGYRVIKEHKDYKSQIDKMNGDLSKINDVYKHELFNLSEDLDTQFGDETIDLSNGVKIPKTNYIQVGDKIIIYSNDRNIILSFDYDNANKYVDNPEEPKNIKNSLPEQYSLGDDGLNNINIKYKKS